MFDLLIGLTAAVSAQAVPAAAPPARPLAAVPGITIKYYDLVGKNEKALKQALDLRAKDAAGQPQVATTEWTISAKVQKRTENGVCKIIGAEPTFTAVAEVPRLGNPHVLKPAEKANWEAFVAQAQADAASDLWIVHDNLGQVRSALMASTCEGTAAAIQGVTQRLTALEAQHQQQRMAANAAKAAAAAAAAAAKAKEKAKQPPVNPVANPY